MDFNFRDSLRHFGAGLLMGGADIIPGVSGGTMALIVGVYERLVAAISTLVSFGLSLAQLDIAAAREHWRAVPWGLVLPLGAGIGVALVVGARVIPGLLERYPEQMLGLFFGLVAASLVIPWLRIRAFRLHHGALLVGMAVLAFWLTGLSAYTAAAPGLLRVFGSAAFAICAMILPGVSGAFLLKATGIYEPTLNALNELNVAYILAFVGGAAVGLGAFAKLLDLLLSRYHDATMAALIGLIAGALRALWPYAAADGTLQGPGPADPVGEVFVLAVLGAVFVLALVWQDRRTAAEETAA
jgi:putative membrane protein